MVNIAENKITLEKPTKNRGTGPAVRPVAGGDALKPYYQDDYVTIYHADCREALKLIPDNSVDLVLTDPPYNIGEKYLSHSDYQDNYELWCKSWFSECLRIGKALTLTPGTRNLVMWTRFEPKPAWVHCWYKPNATNRTGAQWINVWEPILRYGGRWKHYQDSLRANIGKQNDTGNFPCPKSLAWADWLITGLTESGDIILDPFLGSGTTAICAKKLNRKCIGIEIEERYCELSAQRCSQGVFNIVTDNLKKCYGCGISFNHKRGDAKYCSPSCKQKAYRQRSKHNNNCLPVHQKSGVGKR